MLYSLINYQSCRTHLTGAICHGDGLVYTYLDLFLWPHDCNIVINIILDILSRQRHIPPVLYLQLDNTARENKNQYLLAFLAYLVEQRVFKEVNN